MSNLYEPLRTHLWNAAKAAANEYSEARWPEHRLDPLFVHEKAEHFMDLFTRAFDEACDTLDESRESPEDWAGSAAHVTGLGW